MEVISQCLTTEWRTRTLQPNSFAQARNVPGGDVISVYRPTTKLDAPQLRRYGDGVGLPHVEQYRASTTGVPTLRRRQQEYAEKDTKMKKGVWGRVDVAVS
jgi:hypothetical protein